MSGLISQKTIRSIGLFCNLLSLCSADLLPPPPPPNLPPKNLFEPLRRKKEQLFLDKKERKSTRLQATIFNTNHFPESLTKLILLNQGLFSPVAAMMAESLCSSSWERHSVSTSESLVCASSSSSSLRRCSVSTTLTLVLNETLPSPSNETCPSSEKRAAQFSQDPTRLCGKRTEF